jgi:predicted metal-dependent hydrolase
MPHYQYGQHRIDYSVRRSARRTLAVSVDRQEGVVARAPQKRPEQKILAFSAAKAGWILRHQLAQRAQFQSAPQLPLGAGAMVLYRGEKYPLRVEASKPALSTPPVHLEGAGLVVCTPVAEAAVLRELLSHWYRREAMRLLRPRIRHYSEQLGLPMPPLYIRTQARRWGSCNSAGEIRLNWRLVLLPPLLADYVCAHEVCHLKVMNHSARFWRLLGSLYPDWQAARRELRDTAGQYDF